MGAGSAGTLLGSPRPSAAPSHLHRTADGSLWLLFRPPGLQNPMDNHLPASTSLHHAWPQHRSSDGCCLVGPQGLQGPPILGSPLDPSGSTTPPRVQQKAEQSAGPSPAAGANDHPWPPGHHGAASTQHHFWHGHHCGDIAGQ